MITSQSNGRIKYLSDLLLKARLRRKDMKFVAEGIKMFLEAPLDRIEEVYISEELEKKVNTAYPEDKALADKLGKVNYEVVTESVFKKISDTVTPQGIISVIKIKETPLDSIMAGETPLIVCLENLQDPGNLGTILRTAEGAGVDGIILSRDCVDIYNPKVTRSTMGSVFRMKFAYVDDLNDTISLLKKKDIRVYAAALDKKSASYDSRDFSKGSAILIGNEGNGLKEETIKASNETIFIPMVGQVESLNASVAAAVIMYEALRQRKQK